MDQSQKPSDQTHSSATELAAAQKRITELEHQLHTEQTTSRARGEEISAARIAAHDSETQIESARLGSADLEAQLDRCRELDIDRRSSLDQWIGRCVAIERSLRTERLRTQSSGSTTDPSLARVFSTLNTRPTATLVESWPLTEAIPPGDLIYRTSGHRNREHFGLSRAPGLKVVLGLAEEGGCDTEKIERVLDFGCGCGRLLAAWEPYYPSVEVSGVDLDGDLIDWCNTHLPFADARQNQLEPPLDYPDEHFDLVYAASVFTHLTADAALAWANELHRLLRPGGTLVASYHGPHYHEILRESSEDDYAQLNKTGFHVTQKRRNLTIPRTEGSNSYAAFHSRESFRRLFSDWDLRVTSLAADRGATHFASHQDVMVFHRN